MKIEYNKPKKQKETKETYSREEVESLLFNLAEHYAMTSSKSEIDDFNEWIKENLK